MELTQLSVKETYEQLKDKKIAAVEITKAYLDRIKKVDGQIKALLLETGEEALKTAEKADRLLATADPYCWLTGVPHLLKDNLVTEGVRTTAASKILENFNPVYDATVVNNLKKVTSPMLGKTNMDEFAMGASTENSAYQITTNPWDLERVPGGSSGGSAAAVAADLTAFALGSDTGGSIRQPASFCGVVGLKPTYGRVSRYGLIAMGSSLDQVGPITKTVEDAALVLNIIAGFDPKDGTTIKKELPDYSKNINQGVKGAKIGVPKEYFGDGVDQDVKTIVKEALAKFQDLGAELVEISLPNTREGIPVYYILMAAEVSTNLSRFDGIRFGHSRDKFGPETKRRIMLGTYALSSGYYDAYYLKAAKVRRLVKEDFDKAFEQVDLIMGPVAPTTAFKIGEKASDPLQMYLSDLLTVPISLAGLPALSVNAGFSSGLPVGLQIIGPAFSEEKILQAGQVIEAVTPRKRPTL